MNNDDFDLTGMLDQLDEAVPLETAQTELPPLHDMGQLLRRISVKLTLEVGDADLSLAELCNISQGSVLGLDKLAGEPLDMKVNGTLIGRAEVVVAGENYGLRVVEIDDLTLDGLAK